MSTWHVNHDDLAAYRAGAVDPVLAASVEAHLLGCGVCRAALARSSDAGTLTDSQRRWDALTAVVDRPRHETLARLGLSTRPLLAAWAAAVAAVFLVPVLPGLFVGIGIPTLLLAMAPLVPTAAVALAYRVGADPVGEMALATPLAGLRLVSRRALLVGLAALPLGMTAAVVLRLPLSLALAWVLPGLALSALVLLAGTTRLDPAVAAAGLGSAWALAIGVPSAVRRATGEVVAEYVSSAPVQLTALAVAVVALAVTVSRREQVAYRRTS